MSAELNPDVIVVGAGPAGSSAAYHLTRLGRHVLLLDRARFPRDKSCGDGLTRLAVRQLAAMGVLDQFEHAQPARGVCAYMRRRGTRTFEYPGHLAAPNHGLVVKRAELDHVLCRAAVAAGAELWEQAHVIRLVADRNGVRGVEVERGTARMVLRAPVVVAADGSASTLVHRARLFGPAHQRPGVAIRAYYENIEGLSELLEFYTPLLDPSDRYLLPSYGWVFPVGPGTANIGVGIFESDRSTNVRHLLVHFLELLQQSDSRFRALRQCSPLKGAPMRFDFTPDRCAAPGFAAVGDAAGLISPFTGEGIGYALESGRLAAETIAEGLPTKAERDDRPPDLSGYATRLARSYTGYFETGRHSARRYKLVWHVLESTFQNERPLFALCRQVALFPEGLGESYIDAALDDVSDFVDGRTLPVRSELVTVGELLIDSVRHDWPFLARALTAAQSDPGIPFRPGLLLLLASYVYGQDRGSAATTAAAAIELAFLAAIAHTSVEDDEQTRRIPARHSSDSGEGEKSLWVAADGSQPANWGNMSALLVGDFLLARAYQLGAVVGRGASRLLSEGLAQVCEGRMQELRNAHNRRMTEAEHLEIVERKTAQYFEVPCRLGAALGGASPREIATLGQYGRALGIAYELTNEAMSAAGRPSKLARVLNEPAEAGLYGLPLLLAMQSDGRGARELSELAAGSDPPAVRERVIGLVRQSGAIEATLNRARQYASQADAALAGLPEGAARRSLSGLTRYVVERAE